MMLTVKGAIAVLGLSAGAGVLAGLPTTPSPQDKEPVAQGTKVTKQVSDKRVTHAFANASLADVLKWLTAEGISFAASMEGVPAEKRITCNFTNAPIEDVMQAVAAAFGGQWVKKGSVYVYRPSGLAFFDGAHTVPFDEADLWRRLDHEMLDKMKIEIPEGLMHREWRMDEFPELERLPQFVLPKIEEVPHYVLPKLDALRRNELRAMPKSELKGYIEPEIVAPRALEDLQDLPELQEAIKEIKKQALELAELARKLKEQGKPDAEIEKEIELRAAELEKALQQRFEKKGTHLELAPEVRGDRLLLGDLLPKVKWLKERDAVNLKIEKAIGKAPRIETYYFKGIDAQKLVESITAEQWAKHRKQGFLSPTDLTATQLGILGPMPKGTTWVYQFSIADRNLTIKSK